MSKNIKFELDLKGLNSLMKSGEMSGLIDEKANALAVSLEGEVCESAHPISFISIATVRPSRDKTKEDVRAAALALGLDFH